MNTKDKLTHEVITECCKRIAVIEKNAQRTEDCDQVCRELNEAAKILAIDANFETLATVHMDSIAVAAYTCSPLSLLQIADLMDEARYIYRFEDIETPGYGNDGKAIAFGIDGFLDQLIVAFPVHSVVTAEEAYEAAVMVEQIERLAA